ncbi:helix-turn-helix transcriptional regulator [Virgisporangium ochraceum]
MASPDVARELRDFLTSRRAALTPESVGLPPSVGARRVPGLRREEVAMLAGVSVDYYVKLEQGRAVNVSEQVLEAIERVLRLDGLESRHLRSLLRATHRPRSAPGPTETPAPKARAAVRTMVDAMTVPAIVHGPLLEVLGLNAVAKALFADFEAMPVGERNLARWMFLDPSARRIYLEWDRHAAQMVAILRAAAQGPHAGRLAHLVGELSVASPDFARHWADYRLHQHTHGVKRFGNELVGELRLHYQALPLQEDAGQTVVVYHADPGSPSAEKLELLSSWVLPAEVRQRPRRGVP